MRKLALFVFGGAVFSCVIGHPWPLLVTVVLCWILLRYCGPML